MHQSSDAGPSTSGFIVHSVLHCISEGDIVQNTLSKNVLCTIHWYIKIHVNSHHIHLTAMFTSYFFFFFRSIEIKEQTYIKG